MKRGGLWILIIFILFLVGCRHDPLTRETIIDWADFIKWDGVHYDRNYSGVLADESYIGEKLGTVKFKIADNVNNPNYKSKDGDAAFHEKGTEVFAVKENTNIIAVKVSEEINGYQLYGMGEEVADRWDFKQLPIDQVRKVEIYQLYTPEGIIQRAEWKNKEEVERLIQLLTNSRDQPNFQPNTEKGDSDYYEMVFYIGESPIAYKYSLLFDGNTYYWYPLETAILPNDIQEFLQD